MIRWYDYLAAFVFADFMAAGLQFGLFGPTIWHGKDMNLESKNKIKLKTCVKHGYNVILVLDGEEINATNLD
jgi:hypothetical protein